MTSDHSDVNGRLIEERDHLLKSIRDLEREHRFGDMDEADYQRLRAGYTARAAEVIRRIESGGTVAAGKANSLVASPRRSRVKVIGVSALIIGFAVASGVLVARSTGQRGTNPITGSSGSIREQLATCQPLSFQKPEQGIKCYADILKKAPENLEALTYQGWAYVRAGDVKNGGANFAKVIRIDPTYSDVRVFRAVIAVRAGDFASAADELTEFYRNNPSSMAVQVLQSQGLEREIFFGLLPGTVSACWQQAAQAGKDSEQLDEKFYGTLATCLDVVLGASPTDVDALVSRAFAAAGSASMAKGSTIEAATPFLDRTLAVDPTNANALVLRASLNATSGFPDAAKEDLATLETLPRPTISFLTGGPDQIAAGLP